MSQQVGEDLLADDNFALDMIHANPMALRMLPEHKTGYQCLYMSVMYVFRCTNIANDANAPKVEDERFLGPFRQERCRHDPDLVLAAVTGDGRCLSLSPLQRNEDFVREVRLFRVRWKMLVKAVMWGQLRKLIIFAIASFRNPTY